MQYNVYAIPGISQIVFVLSPARYAQVDVPSISPRAVSSPPQATMNLHLWWFAETLTRLTQHSVNVMSFTSHPRIWVVDMRPILPVGPSHELALLTPGTSGKRTTTATVVGGCTRVMLRGANHHHLWPLRSSVPISKLGIVMGCCHVSPKHQCYWPVHHVKIMIYIITGIPTWFCFHCVRQLYTELDRNSHRVGAEVLGAMASNAGVPNLGQIHWPFASFSTKIFWIE